MTSAPTLAKNIVSETYGQNFEDFSKKTDLTVTNGETHVTTDLGKEDTLEPTPVTFKGVTEDDEKDDSRKGETLQNLKARIRRYSTKKNTSTMWRYMRWIFMKNLKKMKLNSECTNVNYRQ